MIIYGIENTISGKWYIGKTTKPEEHRWIEHERSLKKGKHTNCHLQSAWDKYGSEAFTFTPLGSARHEVELNQLEQIFISFYDSFDNGYNLTTGGDGGWKHSEQTKKKISEANKGNTYSLGRKLTVTQKEAIRLAQSGKNVSVHTRQRLSDNKKQYWSQLTEEEKIKQNGFYGKTHSQETIERLRLVNLGRKHAKVNCPLCGTAVASNTITRHQRSSTCKSTNLS